MKHTNVEGHADLVRDNSTGAILNNDTSQYNQYLALRAKRKQGTDRIDNICLLYTSPSPRDRTRSRMPSSA